MFRHSTCRMLGARVAVCFTFVVLWVGSVGAQGVALSGDQKASREELARRVAVLEQQRVDAGKAWKLDGAPALELSAIRNRLTNGDFRVGDRFVVTFLKDSVRSDTASVRDSLKVTVMSLPDISLAGVLRSELDQRMSAHVARYLRGMTVRTNVLTRIAVLGAVHSPGFYYASPDRPLSDLVMLAGGPDANANLKQLEVFRAGRVLLKAKASDRLVRTGATLAQVDIQSGDEVRVPVKRKLNWQSILQLLFVFSTLFFAVLQFLMWYYNRQSN